MHKQHPASHPFALMMEPERVIQAMERSERLARLQRRVCHPLDKPAASAKAGDAEDFDVEFGTCEEPRVA